MTKSKARVGISLRIVEAQNYNEKRDALSQDWVPFLETLSFQPIFLPNNLSDVQSYLTEIELDAFILSGGDDLGVHPERDRTEKKIIEFAVNSKIPICGVCRGMQIINDYFQGSLVHNSSSNHTGKRHILKLVNETFADQLGTYSLDVNSFHNNTIIKEGLGNHLEPFAKCDEDNTIEGFFHNTLPIVGVMWHLERDPNPTNELILKKSILDKAFWYN